MASALKERLDPIALLFPPAATIGTDPAGSRAFDDFVVDTHPAAPEENRPPAVSAPGRFSVPATIIAVAAHTLVAAAFYLLAVHKAPDDSDLGDSFEVTVAQDRAGQADGTADQAPNGAPKPDTAADRQAHAPQTDSEPQPQPAPAAPPAPPQAQPAPAVPPAPPQPPSFSAMPMPTTPPPVPDTADAWIPRVQPAPSPPSPPPAAPAPPPRPVTAAAPHVVPRPSMQKSVDIRNIPGHAPTSAAARGSDNGSFEEGNYGSEVFRAIDRARFYPPRSRERGEEGSVTLRVVIGEGGKLIDAYVTRGSGVPDLDAATVEMARRASFPPLPPNLKPPRTFDVPIEFGVRFFR